MTVKSFGEHSHNPLAIPELRMVTKNIVLTTEGYTEFDAKPALRAYHSR